MGKYSKKMKLILSVFLTGMMTLSLTTTYGSGITEEDHDPSFFDDLGILQELNRVEESEEIVPDIEINPDENLDYMKLLNTLGILEGDENGELKPYKTVTRAEFTAIVLRLAGISDEYFMNIVPGTKNFVDVATDSWYYGAVKTACDMGLVSGYEDGTFRPDKTVTLNEALKLVVCAVGYGGIAEEQGSYPIGYITVAKNLKISKGVSADEEDRTLRKTVGKILYNALFTNTLSRSLDSKNGSGGFYDTGETVAEKHFGVERKKGIIEGINQQMIGGVSDRENVVYISNSAYTSQLAPEMKEHIGSYVEFFVTTDDNLKKEIIYYSVTDKNTTVTVDFKDITNVTEDYVETDGEISKIKLDANPSMLFNERAVLPFDYQLINPVYYDSFTGTDRIPYGGTAVFTDNNGDGKYDVVNVEAYKTMYLGKVLNLKKTVMDYYVSESGGTEVVDLNPRNLGNTDVEYVMENGKEAAFSSMKAGYVLDIYASTNLEGMNRKMKIVITNRSVSGKITGIEEESVVIAGTKYKISPYYRNTVANYPGYAEALELGTTVKVALNSKREIVAVVSKKDGNNVGYMLDYGKNTDGWFAEIATSDGKVKKLSFAESIKVNGERVSGKEAFKILENTGKGNAPVGYSVNTSEEIKSLDVFELKNPGIVQTAGVGKSIKIDAAALDMGDSRYTHTFDLSDVVLLDDVPIIGIDFGAAGADNSHAPETGLASIEGENTVKIDKSYIGVNRNSENYSNNYYEDRIYLVNFDAGKKTCDLIVFNIGSGGLEEAEAMAPYTVYSGTGNGFHNRFMSETNAVEYDSKANDNILCVNKAYSMKNENGDTVWLVYGMQGGKEVTLNTAPGMKYLTTVNAQDDRINNIAPVQWTPERGASYESEDEDEWFRVSGAKDFYNPSTGVLTYANETAFYFPERFRSVAEPGIKQGDMAFISTNSKGEIVEFQYIANAVDGPERTLCGRPRRASMVRGFCWEPFYGMDGDTINSYYLSNHNHADMAEADVSETIRTIAWDGENDEFIVVSRDDLYGCDAYIAEYDNTDGYTKTGEENNCWLLMNKYNWQCTELIFVDYISNTY